MSRHGVLGLRGDFQLKAMGGLPDRLLARESSSRSEQW